VDAPRTLNSLATLYVEMGRPEQAEPLYQRALTKAEASLEAKHPLITTITARMGYAYLSMGAYDRAKPLMERAITRTEASDNPDGRDAASYISDLADLCSVERCVPRGTVSIPTRPHDIRADTGAGAP
jgi:tetratricopeptide (TPR) repeat protein